MEAVAGHLSVKEFAEIAGVERNTVSRWINNQRLFAEYRNGRWHIPVSDAQLFMTKYERKGGTPLDPDVPGTKNRAKYFRKPPDSTVATIEQSLSVQFSPGVLRRMDIARRIHPDLPSRQELIRWAVLDYLKREGID